MTYPPASTTPTLGQQHHPDLRRDVSASFDVAADLTTGLDFYRRHGDDHLDRWDGRTLIRACTLPTGHHSAGLELTLHPIGYPTRVDARIAIDTPLATTEAADLAASQFRLPKGELTELCENVPHVAAALTSYQHIGVLNSPNLLYTLIRTNSAQQINLEFAATLRRRLAENYGTQLPTSTSTTATLIHPRALADARVTDLRALQFSNRKASYLIEAARAIDTGALTLAGLAAQDDDQATETLTELPGIGRWSAEWTLVRTLGRDVVVSGDLVVRKAVGWLYDLADPSQDAVRRRTDHWGPAAAFAQAALLEAYRGSDQTRHRTGSPT